jgi:hypothetical protein
MGNSVLKLATHVTYEVTYIVLLSIHICRETAVKANCGQSVTALTTIQLNLLFQLLLFIVNDL